LVIAQDGNEAWRELQRPGAPRLAILDWVMPGLSGPQICRKIRASSTLSSTYLILLTARNNEGDIVSGLRAGADDYITKPPVPAELHARIRMGERVLSLQDAVKAHGARNAQPRLFDDPDESAQIPVPLENVLGTEKPSCELILGRTGDSREFQSKAGLHILGFLRHGRT
jgi:DNA-binding response OmpR family regulator